MHHDPRLFTGHGHTIAMLCVMYNREIEHWMRHDPTLVD